MKRFKMSPAAEALLRRKKNRETGRKTAALHRKIKAELAAGLTLVEAFMKYPKNRRFLRAQIKKPKALVRSKKVVPPKGFIFDGRTLLRKARKSARQSVTPAVTK